MAFLIKGNAFLWYFVKGIFLWGITFRLIHLYFRTLKMFLCYLLSSIASDEKLAIIYITCTIYQIFFLWLFSWLFFILIFSPRSQYAYVWFSLYLNCMKFSGYLINGSMVFINLVQLLIIMQVFLFSFILFSSWNFS